MQESDAQYTLKRLDLVLVKAETGYDKSKPTGCVLAQNPESGTKVKAGRQIYVTINASDSPTRALPDIADNSSLREAQAKLKAMGFKLGPVEYIPGDKDWVYAVKCRGRFVYSGEQVPTDVPLILQVGNTSSIEAEEEMLDSLDDFDIGDIDDEAVGIDEIFDL
jgi:beta-lactam-binding protein with PASTA domain